MQKKIVSLNGQGLHEDGDYSWVQGELVLTFEVSRNAPQNHDRLAVETYDEGLLVRRETFEILRTAANEKMRWHRCTIDRFRDRDC